MFDEGNSNRVLMDTVFVWVDSFPLKVSFERKVNFGNGSEGGTKDAVC